MATNASGGPLTRIRAYGSAPTVEELNAGFTELYRLLLRHELELFGDRGPGEDDGVQMVKRVIENTPDSRGTRVRGRVEFQSERWLSD